MARRNRRRFNLLLCTGSSFKECPPPPPLLVLQDKLNIRILEGGGGGSGIKKERKRTTLYFVPLSPNQTLKLLSQAIDINNFMVWFMFMVYLRRVRLEVNRKVKEKGIGRGTPDSLPPFPSTFRLRLKQLLSFLTMWRPLIYVLKCGQTKQTESYHTTTSRRGILNFEKTLQSNAQDTASQPWRKKRFLEKVEKVEGERGEREREREREREERERERERDRQTDRQRESLEQTRERQKKN